MENKARSLRTWVEIGFAQNGEYGKTSHASDSAIFFPFMDDFPYDME